MLKLYGNKMSGNCTKVEYVCKLLKLSYEFKEMDFKKDLKTPEFLRINPSGKIPAIDDNGFTLFESSAIVKYLCAKEKNELYPTEIKQRALVDQWIDFSSLHLGAGVGKVAWNRVFAPNMNLPSDENALKSGLADCDRFLPILDTQLQKHAHLAGEKLSLADINLLGVLMYAEMAKIDLSLYQHVITWRKNLQEMDFYKEVHA